jgi:hypothetical protein
MCMQKNGDCGWKDWEEAEEKLWSWCPISRAIVTSRPAWPFCCLAWFFHLFSLLLASAHHRAKESHQPMVHSYAYNEDVCMQSMYSEFKHTLTFPSKLFVLPFSHEEFNKPKLGRWVYKTACSFLWTELSMHSKRHWKSMSLLNSKQICLLVFQDWNSLL